MYTRSRKSQREGSVERDRAFYGEPKPRLRDLIASMIHRSFMRQSYMLVQLHATCVFLSLRLNPPPPRAIANNACKAPEVRGDRDMIFQFSAPDRSGKVHYSALFRDGRAGRSRTSRARVIRDTQTRHRCTKRNEDTQSRHRKSISKNEKGIHSCISNKALHRLIIPEITGR